MYSFVFSVFYYQRTVQPLLFLGWLAKTAWWSSRTLGFALKVNVNLCGYNAIVANAVGHLVSFRTTCSAFNRSRLFSRRRYTSVSLPPGHVTMRANHSMCRYFYFSLARTKAAIKSQFVAHKKLEKTTLKLTKEIAEIEVKILQHTYPVRVCQL